MPEIDLMIGGPSCQAFHVQDAEINLIPAICFLENMYEWLMKLNPNILFSKNVEGFVDMQFIGYKGITGIEYPDGSVTPFILRSELSEIGYDTLEPRILNAADYGVPQKKKSNYFYWISQRF